MDVQQSQILYTNDDFDELAYYDKLHAEKYRDKNQSKDEHIKNIADNLATDGVHKFKLYDSLKFERFLPAGRVQAAMGATEREVSPFNCSVSQRIDDSMDSIMDSVSKAAKILRLGTGIGYNFSNLRPRGAEIKKLHTESSGPLSFMKIFDVMASTIASSGHRRGAQMGIMNVDHPDILSFITAKMEAEAYRQFNLSVGITDAFMEAVSKDLPFQLQFSGRRYQEVRARELWEKIVRTAYESAEPGIIFIDRLNDNNNLYYCERIEATNPCAEQPLPPYGLCTLGSFNLTAYIKFVNEETHFDMRRFIDDIQAWVEAYDNLFDRSIYAIPEHKEEALNKRRMGLGLTGIANAIEHLLGYPSYGEANFCSVLKTICETLRDTAYHASTILAKSRGPFKLYNNNYLNAKFIKSLPSFLQQQIAKTGIRNSHLISFAPCGTISQCAGNISSGVEPVFHYKVSRDVYMRGGKINIALNDYNVRNFGFKGKTLEECSVQDHMNVAEVCQKYCDSAVSKTVNVSKNCSYEDYAQIYIQAHKLGLKGITVFKPTELRGAVILESKEHETIPTSCVNGACSM